MMLYTELYLVTQLYMLKGKKNVLLMFQLLIDQPDLPGKRQNGLACGNPEFGPLPGHGSSESSLLRQSSYTPFSFQATPPWVRQQVRATGIVLCQLTFFPEGYTFPGLCFLKGLLVEACSPWVEVHQILSHPEK